MYLLKKDNIERVVSDEITRDMYVLKGYTVLAGTNDQVAKTFEEMDVESLTAYAKEHNIELGRTTSKSKIIEKIRGSLQN